MIGRIPVLDVRPLVDCGRRPAKAVVGETFQVTATVFREGHDAVAANVVLRDPAGRPGPWTPMRELAPGHRPLGRRTSPRRPRARWTFPVEAWSDPVATWRHTAEIKIPAGHRHRAGPRGGRRSCYERAAAGVPEARRPAAACWPRPTRCATTGRAPAARLAAALTAEVTERAGRAPAARTGHPLAPLPLWVERERALFGSWYELFPRSEGAVVRRRRRRPGTARSGPRPSGCRPIAAMGFDVVYLPPIHPIGTTYRKGREQHA